MDDVKVESKTMAIAFSKTGTLYDDPLTCDGNEIDTTYIIVLGTSAGIVVILDVRSSIWDLL